MFVLRLEYIEIGELEGMYEGELDEVSLHRKHREREHNYNNNRGERETEEVKDKNNT